MAGAPWLVRPPRRACLRPRSRPAVADLLLVHSLKQPTQPKTAPVGSASWEGLIGTCAVLSPARVSVWPSVGQKGLGNRGRFGGLTRLSRRKPVLEWRRSWRRTLWSRGTSCMGLRCRRARPSICMCRGRRVTRCRWWYGSTAAVVWAAANGLNAASPPNTPGPATGPRHLAATGCYSACRPRIPWPVCPKDPGARQCRMRCESVVRRG